MLLYFFELLNKKIKSWSNGNTVRRSIAISIQFQKYEETLFSTDQTFGITIVLL